MRVTRHGEHLVQLTKYPGLFPINCYLVIEDDGLTLVDTQVGSPAEDIARAASDLGSEVKRVLLTHAHSDHIGGVPDVKKRFPSAEIAIGVRDARLLEGDAAPAPGEPPVNAKGAIQKVGWKPDRLLEEGDRIGSLRVIASPGHTPGHIAFFDTRDSSLIAGDAYQTRGRVAVTGDLVLLFPFLALATWHKPTALATAIALRALNPSRLGVGHGDVVENPGPAMDAAIERALVLNLLDLLVLIVLTALRGWPVVGFALGGLLISVGYAAPGIRLKKRGLGEPGVFLVWGPLMVGGIYYAATGTLPWQVLAASGPYALLATAVLLGKHIDKLPWDRELGIGTLPVLVGEPAARRLTLAVMAAFYVAIPVLLLVHALPWPALIALAGAYRLYQAWPHFRRPKPDRPPGNNPVWPLWFAAIAFVHTRRAGALLVLGLLVGSLLGFVPGR